MHFEIPERARELLIRAGLGGLSDGAAAGLAAAVVCVIALAAWRFWPAPGGVEVSTGPATPVVAAQAADAVGSTEESGTQQLATVTVHVVGAVLRPGVYSLPEGSRVSDAVAAAGGATGTAAEEGINLARVLADGEQVRMLTAEEVAAGVTSDAGSAVSPSGGAPSAGGKVDLNRASAAELDTLPGIGPSTAQKIIDDREANGPFKTIEDLMRVSGIGQKKFDSLKELLTVG